MPTGSFIGEAWAEKRPGDEFEGILNRLYDHPNKRNALPAILIGLAIVGHGLVQKDVKQLSNELGDTEIQPGKKDGFFPPYFIMGGIAGLVMPVSDRTSRVDSGPVMSAVGLTI